MITLPFVKKGPHGEQPPGNPEDKERKKRDDLERDQEVCKRRLKLYQHILSRYREQIEMGETKTVSDLRNLVNPESKAILEVRERITESFRPYIYEKHFDQAATKAFEFMRDGLGNDVLPLDFWLSPEEVLDIGLADEMDKAIFLCSLLISLDNGSSKVVVETNGQRHAFVLFEFKGKFHIMDPVHNINKSGTREELLQEHIKDRQSKVVYEFNNKGYNEW